MKKKVFEEIKAEYFLDLVKNIHLQIQEILKIPSRTHSKKATYRHTLTKILKTEDKNNT